MGNCDVGHDIVLDEECRGTKALLQLDSARSATTAKNSEKARGGMVVGALLVNEISIIYVLCCLAPLLIVTSLDDCVSLTTRIVDSKRSRFGAHVPSSVCV